MSEDQEQRKLNLYNVQDHLMMVEGIVKALCNIDYFLEKLKMLDAEYSKNPFSREHAEERLHRALKQDFHLLELPTKNDYINSFGAFFTLYNSLKEQYKKEVLVPKNPQPTTHN